ncbi:signal recognition particle-docking protein FtsY [candidate division KSB1 bacterium 4572_119]|nr:MAG: signal recognition particle-docking protein FtsY [candidate division KSB1 bacterium 4572_119]
MIRKLKQRLTKTREGFVGRVNAVIKTQNEINENLYETLEEILIGGDLGVDFSMNLIEEVRDKVEELGIKKPENILRFFKSGMLKALTENNISSGSTGDLFSRADKKPYVIMVVGVNGTGKTTTIGKLAAQFKERNKTVLLSAADTFRAAASDQLAIWAKRANVEIIRNQPGADPAAVAFDSLQAAISRNVDVLIVDTAGRLHTKSNLMEELKKIGRVLGKLIPEAPHETLLVLDATTGQNGLNQAKQFTKVVGVNGIVLTKLDGTAKGGIVFSIGKELGIPVQFIGLGEKIEDLEHFDPEEFVEALFQ